MGAVKQLFISQSEDLAKEYQIPFELVQELGTYAKDDDEWKEFCEKAAKIINTVYSQVADYVIWGDLIHIPYRELEGQLIYIPHYKSEKEEK